MRHYGICPYNCTVSDFNIRHNTNIFSCPYIVTYYYGAFAENISFVRRNIQFINADVFAM